MEEPGLSEHTEARDTCGRVADSAKWQGMLGRFKTIGLGELGDLVYTDRLDTKFVLRQDRLFEMLNGLADDYRVLDIDDTRYTSYRTQYFDTPSFELFRRHHSDAAGRHKVRTRLYLNTSQSVIEVKSKTKTGATAKVRAPTGKLLTELDDTARGFVRAELPQFADALQPSLLNGFDRLCFISTHRPERLTVDLDIAVFSGGEVIPLPGVAVAELKQQRRDVGYRDSEFLRLMRSANVRPTGFSKYCICLSMTRRDIKHNRFKPQLRTLERLMGRPHAID